MKVYITGISGTGKSTIAHELDKCGIRALNLDDIPGLCQYRHKETKEQVFHDSNPTKEFIETHEWVCDVELLKKLINEKGNTVVAVGIISNQDEYLDLFDKVLLLQCSPETFVRRIEQRTDKDFGKDKGTQESLLNFYERFEERLLAKGAVPINAEAPIEEVVEQVMNEIEKEQV